MLVVTRQVRGSVRGSRSLLWEWHRGGRGSQVGASQRDDRVEPEVRGREHRTALRSGDSVRMIEAARDRFALFEE